MAKRHLSEREILGSLEDTQRRYPRAWQNAHREGHPERYDFMVLAGKALFVLSGGTVSLNWRRAVHGDLSMDGLSVENPSDGRYYFEDIIGGAGGATPQLKYRHPFNDAALLRARPGGPYTPEGFVTERDLARLQTAFDYSGTVVVPPSQPPAPVQPCPDQKVKPYVGDVNGPVIGQILFDDYAEGGQPMNPGVGVWFLRISHDFAVNGMALADAIEKQRNGPDGWRKALGLPPKR